MLEGRSVVTDRENDMNILVCGGTRMMGKHLVTELLSKDHTVTIATRGRAKDSFGDQVHRICLDRTDVRRVKEALSGLEFDLVYDSLAYSSNDVRRLLDHLTCGRYITISSTAVYHKHLDTVETEFDPLAEPVKWCDRVEVSYDEGKRQAERAITQVYSDVDSVRVRFPFVLGEDDYTNRLSFYVDHIINQIPMDIDNFECQMAFVRSDEAGKFLAFLADHPFCGAVNGASRGTISLKEIAAYIKGKTGQEPLLSREGERAPYNGERAYSINVDRAERLGFSFTHLNQWIFDLLDHDVAQCKAAAKD